MPKVEWLAERELAALPLELAAHARLVALLGGEFSGAEVEGVLGELEARGLGESFPLDAQVGIRRLLANGLLITHRDGRYGFRHQLIRDHVAQSMPAEARAEVHRAAFRYYQGAWSLPKRVRMPRLAQHAAECHEDEIASGIYLDLAEQASRRHSYIDAELMYTRALGLLRQGDERNRMRAYNGRGLMRYRLSRFEDSLQDLDIARTIARALASGHAEIDIYLDEATVYDWMRDFQKSKALVLEVKALACNALTPLLEARLCLGLGRSCYRFRDTDEARRLLERAAQLAQTQDDQGYETLVISLMLLGLVFGLQNERELAIQTFAQVVTLCEERGDKLHLASALNNRREILVYCKDAVQAAADALRCQQIGREIGQGELEYICAYNLGELYYFAGDLEAAEPHVARAVALEPNNNKKPISRLLECRLLTYSGRLEQARQVLRAVELQQESSRRHGDADALFIESEEVFYTMTKLAVHLAPWQDWQELLAEANSTSQPEELAELSELAALTELRRGHRERGLELLRQSLDQCRRTSHLIEARIERQLEAAAGQG